MDSQATLQHGEHLEMLACFEHQKHNQSFVFCICMQIIYTGGSLICWSHYFEGVWPRAFSASLLWFMPLLICWIMSWSFFNLFLVLHPSEQVKSISVFLGKMRYCLSHGLFEACQRVKGLISLGVCAWQEKGWRDSRLTASACVWGCTVYRTHWSMDPNIFQFSARGDAKLN